MSLTATPNGDRVQIAIFGRRNAGKSSVINAVTGQQLAIVSDVKGTTTDPVYKAMEILPIGPCMFIDTPGLDDEGALGRMRVEKAIEVLNRTDIAMLVLDVSRLTKQELESGRGMGAEEEQILAMIEEKKLPYVIVLNQADKLSGEELTHRCQCIMAKNGTVPVCAVSTVQNMGLDALKDALVMLAPDTDLKLHILGDLVEKDDVVLLVVPVDSAAPKGRLIIEKTDKDTGAALKGAEFELRDADGKVVETLTTDENGHATSGLLAIGTYKDGKFDKAAIYYLVETKAPEGYQMDETKHEVTFTYVDDKTPVIEVIQKVTNEKLPEDTPSVSNPKTGDDTNLWFPALCLILSTGGLIGMGVASRRKKKKGGQIG